MPDYITAELMACALARSFPDGAWGATGANSQIATAAMQLARLTSAPNLTLMLGGAGAHNPGHPLVWSSSDERWLWRAESVFRMDEVVNWQLGGYRKREMIACLGGMQVDRYGNANMIGIGSDHAAMKVRGPGTVGLYFATRFHRIFLLVARHDRRIFPEAVDYISMPGRTAARAKHCLPHSVGPVQCVTPLCVFGFADDGEMVVESLHPGVTIEEVRDRTGWDVRVAEPLATTQPPSAEELRILREVVDPLGILRDVSVSGVAAAGATG